MLGRAENMERLYVHYTHLFVRHQDNNPGLFRTLVDNWYGYWQQGAFLNANGRPIWLNNPRPARINQILAETPMGIHFVSAAAQAVLAGGPQTRLVKDHAIPLRVVLRTGLFVLAEPMDDDIRAFLQANYRLGIVTHDEHTLLNQAGLGRAMPDGWDDWNDWDARYAFAGIQG